MSDKLAVILASSDRKVLEMGLVYARNVAARGWMEDMKLFFFGPSEVAIATDPDLQELVKTIVSEGTVPRACKWCSDKYGVSDMLEALGCVVEYIGSPVSEAIREDYTPMTW
jgi:hypothetical protein